MFEYTRHFQVSSKSVQEFWSDGGSKFRHFFGNCLKNTACTIVLAVISIDHGRAFVLLARDVGLICTSRAYATMSVSVCL